MVKKGSRSSSKKKDKGRKKYRIEMTALSAAFWSFCLLFLLSWIFVLGILVGRGFLPDAVTALADLRGQINRLQTIVNHNKTQEGIQKKKPESDPKLDFYEELSNKKYEAKKKWTPPKKRKTALGDKIPQIKAEPPKRVVVETKNKQVEKPVPIEQSPPISPGAAEGYYTVQLASLKEESKAQKMSARLIDRGYPAYFYTTRINGKDYYRVRCGRFDSRKEAESYAVRLKRELGMKGFVSRLE